MFYVVFYAKTDAKVIVDNVYIDLVFLIVSATASHFGFSHIKSREITTLYLNTAIDAHADPISNEMF